MKEIKNKELNNIVGGAISGTVINGIVKGAQLLLELGRSFGSAIRRFFTRSYC